MNEHQATPNEEMVRDLLGSAGTRPPLPVADLAIIRASAHAEWNKVRYGQESQTGRWPAPRTLALAAGLLLMVLLGWWWIRASAPAGSDVIATVEALAGAGMGLAVGEDISAGAVLETAGRQGAAAERLAIRLSGGQSVRLDVGTTLKLISSTHLELAQGAIYVDSGPVLVGEVVEIDTAFGSIRDLGTQFEVRLGSGDAPVRVRVRQGEVVLDSEGNRYSAAAGEELTLRRDGSVERAALAAHGEEWQWVLSVAAPFSIEGQSLRAYLDWLTRETGWRVQFADPKLEQTSVETVLHGTLDGLTPKQSLDVVLAGSGLAYRLEDGDLLILNP